MDSRNWRCAKPGCRYRHESNSAFCGHHRVYRVLCQERDRFLCDNDQFGVELCHALIDAHMKGGNPLMPKKSFVNPERKQYASLYEWWKEKWTKYGPVLRAHIDSTEPQTRARDQEARAVELARQLLPSHRKLRLMDGFGSFTLSLMEKIVLIHGYSRLNTLTIELVDNNAIVNNFHRSFFESAPNVVCTESNITQEKYSASTLVYMNFCGIAPSLNDVTAWLANIPHRITMVNQQPAKLMISWSRSRAAINNPTKARLTRAVSSNGWEFVNLKTDRNDFATVLLMARNTRSASGSNLLAPQVPNPIVQISPLIPVRVSDDFLIALYKAEWKGTQKQFAAKYGGSQSSLSEFLNKKRLGPTVRQALMNWFSEISTG